jgi:ubiquitin thioesterase protein OTUB1
VTIADHSAAIAFSYFETLLRIGDKGRIMGELARLKSANQLIVSSGVPLDIFEDFAQETFELLEKCADSVPTVRDDTAILGPFNSEDVSSSIITHFRVRLG